MNTTQTANRIEDIAAELAGAAMPSTSGVRRGSFAVRFATARE